MSEKLLDLIVTYGGKILLSLVLLFIGRWLIKICLNIINKWSQKLDPTLATFLGSIAKVMLYVILLVTIASTLGIQMTSFIAILGAAGLAIGLALQGSLSNFAGGVLILAFRPFNVGDFIANGNHKGKVKEIKILYTTLITPDNKRVVIPNSELSNNPIVNFSSEETRRVELVFGVGYEDDIMRVKEILTQIVANHELILDDPAPLIRVAEHAASSVNFNVFVWTKAENYWTVHYDLLEEVKLIFDRENISIPYRQLDIHFSKLPETVEE